jgi:hypothetical protein
VAGVRRLRRARLNLTDIFALEPEERGLDDEPGVRGTGLG